MIGLERGAVKLAPYDPSWALEFKIEKNNLLGHFGDHVVAIEHIGSTAVPGMSAKPVIDIEVGVKQFSDWKLLIPLAEETGYTFMPDRVFENYVFMPKGPEKSRTHYLHIAEYGGQEWQNVVDSRDALRRSSELRTNHEELKRKLVKISENRAAYTAAKATFIEGVLGTYRKSMIPKL